MRHPPRHRGFALLMALVLVALAGMVLVGVARRSLLQALDAQEATEELQRRWAVTSLRAALLGRAEELLEPPADDDPRVGRPRGAEARWDFPVRERRVRCQLADIDYELVVTDEQAKLNANRLLAGQGLAEAQRSAARLVSQRHARAADGLTVRLRPQVTPGARAARKAPPPLGGYGQVFDGARPALLIGEALGTGAVSELTCWGDGRVSIRRASDATVELACQGQVDARVVAGLLRARRQEPGQDLAGLMGQLGGLDLPQQSRVTACLTDRSECHGLWVIARQPQRSWYTLAVGIGAGRDPRVPRFVRGGADLKEIHEFAW